ncbi:FAD binding domain-containing protein [Mycena floridula]|nr:FAD binding domain-containing protein [Mycena floridula]
MTSVLIVGAGPTGLGAALTLLKNNVSVRIIEKNTTHRIGRKGWGVQPRTIELHALLGTLDDVLAKSALIPQIKMINKGQEAGIIDMQEKISPRPSCRYVEVRSLGQNQHEAILRSHLAKYGCQVENGSELVSFEQDEDGVVAHILRVGETEPETSEFRWMIAADGGHSMIRKQLGLPFVGETMTERMVIGDIVVKSLTGKEFGFVWNSDRINVSLFPSEIPGSDVFTFVFFGTGLDADKVGSSEEEWLKCFYECSGRRDIEFGDKTWQAIWRLNIRMAETFQQGRVFLGGDAIHSHSPAGGQGLNSSLQDALNLSWKLALVEKGLSPRSLLDSYSKERVPVIAAMLGKTTLLFKKMYKDDTGPKKWERGRETDQLGVNYRDSDIVVDEFSSSTDSYNPYGAGGLGGSGADLVAGDRAPDAPGLSTQAQTLWMLNLFGAVHHTVLIFNSDLEIQQTVMDRVKKYAPDLFRCYVILPKGSATFSDSNIFTDGEGHAYQAYTTNGESRIVVVRPDGVVGAIVAGVTGLDNYLGRIFV